MNALHRLRARQGFSMLEVLTASSILVLGLTGIVVMLTNIANHTRDGSMSINGSVMANQIIQEAQALGYHGLTAAAAMDAGQGVDSYGRKFARQVSVTAFTSDGGVPSYQVDVAVTWKDAMGISRRNFATTVISQAPDAG